MIQLRPYQEESIAAVLDFWHGGGENPLVDLATGLGKSVVIAELMRRLISDYPSMRVLMLVHVRELVSQNFAQLVRLWPGAPAGIYSAGLGKRDGHHRITCASIQSVFRLADIIGPRDLVIIDEAHLVPHGGEGMYRQLLQGLQDRTPDLRVCGFTATPYRLGAGRLDRGPDALFSQTVYSYGVGAGIRDGWLSPITARRGSAAGEIEVDGVARRGGEFVAGALEAAADDAAVIAAAADEIVERGADRRSWLVFCAGVKHAHHVREALQARGVSAATITGETPGGERDSLIAAFKRGELRCLTNANVLTTGFDAPGVDLIAMLRPTLSTGLYIQMVGRGTRQAPGKDNCLILDFAGNVRRHGPVDLAGEDGPGRAKRKKDEDAGAVSVDSVEARECANCEALIPVRASVCPECGHEEPKIAKHAARAEDAPILAAELKPDWRVVDSWSAARHVKPGAPDSLRVTYRLGITSVDEWVCLEHDGYPKGKALAWWSSHGGGVPPADVGEALGRFAELRMPAAVELERDGKWWRIKRARFAALENAA